MTRTSSVLLGRASGDRASGPPGIDHAMAGTPRHSLSARLLWLTMGIVLVTAVLVFVPELVRERRAWLADRITQAHVAALSVAAAPDGMVDTATRDELLHLSGTLGIRVREPGRLELKLPSDPGFAPAAHDDLRTESRLTAARRALGELARPDDRVIEVSGLSPYRPAATVDLLIRERLLSAALRTFAWQSAQTAIVIAIVTGAIVYLALLRFMVRPMRRLTSSIASFRADPEHAAPLETVRVASFGEDEMALAGRELGAMQQDLRAALWRNARLAALGTAMAQVSHDLRGILSPALLAAEAMQNHADPAVGRCGAILIRSIDRATDLVRGMLEFAREGPAPPSRVPVELSVLVAETIESLRHELPECEVTNAVSDALTVEADRNQLLRVLCNLARNAGEAGATRVRVTAEACPVADEAEAAIRIEVADDGPGLPGHVRATLFRPFTSSTKPGGSGLGLAIARDLVRAHGGELELVRTGPCGTVFRLSLPAMPQPALLSA